MITMSRVWREGIITGLLGAGGVALWFFGVDLVAGQPFATPWLLGDALLNVIGSPGQHEATVAVSSYTVFHVAAFIAVGLLACYLVDLARRVPHVTVALLLFFVVFEVGFYFLALVLSQEAVLGRLAWYQIGAANLVASALMGGYIWRHHPELKTEIELALDGRV